MSTIAPATVTAPLDRMPLAAGDSTTDHGRGDALPTPGRDRFVDLLRLFAIVLVVGQHWLLPTLSYQDGVMTVGNALSAPGAPLVTWLTQIMPLIFFAGGAANALSWRSATRRGESGSTWLAKRLARLSTPVLAVAAVWIPLPYLLSGLGLPTDPITDATLWVGRVLWFLPVYLIAVAATPLAVSWGLRRPIVTLVGLAAAALVVDLLRFSVAEPFGYLNMAFVWLAIHQLGILYAAGRLHTLTGGRALLLSAGGFASTALLVAYGPYPLLMLGLPGAGPSNHAPPTFCLLTLSAGILGLAFALRPALERFAEIPQVEAVIRTVVPRMMSIYVWHMTAYMVGAGICVLGLGLSTPTPGSPLWWLSAPLWLAVPGALLVGLLAIFGRVEDIRIVRSRAPFGAYRIAGATLLTGLSLLALTITGFAPAASHQLPVAMLAVCGTGIGLLLIRNEPRETPTNADTVNDMTIKTATRLDAFSKRV